MSEAKLLWTPTAEFVAGSNLTRWNAWLQERKNLRFQNYEEMWSWSTEHVAEFWSCVAEYFEVSITGVDKVLSGTMPEVRWFEGVQLNYAEHIFKQYANNRPAILFQSETHPLKEISWSALKEQVSSLQKFLIDQGVKRGDRVAGYLPCIPEATAAFLAANSIGAIWSSCSPDFGTQSVIDRFAQIEPKVLIAVDGYHYGGKHFDKSDVVRDVIKSLPTLACVILIGAKNKRQTFQYVEWTEATTGNGSDLIFEQVPFGHPMWILYSSGTTGLPKAILHSHGGILLEQLKYLTFHNDVKPGERFFWYTTTGWMMWNYIHGSLLCGATLLLYDGSPAYPDLRCLWKFAADASINHFGTSAAFILSSLKAGLDPKHEFDLSKLRSLSATGSTLPPEGFDWVYRNVKDSLWLASMSGGTDVCSAFVGGNPWLPVYSGEIQCRALGCKLKALDEEGRELWNEVGEMVIQQPMPSMPISFWNDPGKKRYHESYFDVFPGQWRHGDWIEITQHHGVIIYGRSDATLNRGGVRIGTSEIYRAVDKVKEVKDSLIVCIEKDKGEFYMPLFVVMTDGVILTDGIRQEINTTIRNDYSPRHVPDEIIQVPDIPYTISGKKTETPVKKVLMGKDPLQVVNAGALRNPQAIDFFVTFYKSSKRDS